MWAAVSQFFAARWAAILQWVAVAAAVLGVLFAARKSGRDAEKVDALKQTIKNVGVANEVEQNIDRMSDDDVAKRLQQRWTIRE